MTERIAAADLAHNRVAGFTHARELEFAGPGGGVVSAVPIEHMLRRVFAMLAPTRPLPHDKTWVDERAYNWGSDEAYLTAERDALLISLHHIGAVPHARLLSLGGTAETIDIAADALLRVAADNHLVLVRR